MCVLDTKDENQTRILGTACITEQGFDFRTINWGLGNRDFKFGRNKWYAETNKFRRLQIQEGVIRAIPQAGQRTENRLLHISFRLTRFGLQPDNIVIDELVFIPFRECRCTDVDQSWIGSCGNVVESGGTFETR